MKSIRSKSGFTLVEMLVVIAITAFLLTITVGFLTSSVAGNRRTSCQVNLHHLHQALSQYMLDFNSSPPFDPTVPTSPHPCSLSAAWQGAPRAIPQLGNLGLLTLHTYGVTRNDPNTNYLKGVKSLHCPEDDAFVSGQRDPVSPQCPRDLNAPAVQTIFNLDWVSYQTVDPITNEWTYAPFRLYTVNNINNVRANPDYRRQLAVPAACYDSPTTPCPNGGCWDPASGQCVSYSQALSANRLELAPKWHPSDNTVVTWCIFHRSRARPFDHDNVLFWDGSVEFLPAEQLPEGTCTNTRAGAARLPDLERRRECGLP